MATLQNSLRVNRTTSLGESGSQAPRGQIQLEDESFKSAKPKKILPGVQTCVVENGLLCHNDFLL